jgi:type IV pilus assembly protein PilE
MYKKTRGFTLVELMVVVVILGILLAIAVPSYGDYMRKAARAQAKSVVLDLAQIEERYFTNNTTYLAVGAGSVSLPAGWQNYSGSEYASRKYDVTVAAGATGVIGTSFTITATPTNGFSDPDCGTLTLDSRGTKSPANCW